MRRSLGGRQGEQPKFASILFAPIEGGLPCRERPKAVGKRVAAATTTEVLIHARYVGQLVAKHPSVPSASADRAAWRAEAQMIRKLADGRYRLYSRKKDPKTGKRRNLGTFASRTAAEKHERAVQFFKRQG